MAAGADMDAGGGDAVGVAGAAQPPMVITSPASPAVHTLPACDMARLIINRDVLTLICSLKIVQQSAPTPRKPGPYASALW